MRQLRKEHRIDPKRGVIFRSDALTKVSRMLSHERVWAAIDALASRHGLHTSRLARKAGLNATSFNKSKRVSRKGREHWPSTESISKILDVTGTTLKDFLRLIEPSGSFGLRGFTPQQDRNHEDLSNPAFQR